MTIRGEKKEQVPLRLSSQLRGLLHSRGRVWPDAVGCPVGLLLGCPVG